MKILYIFPHPDDESFGPAPAISSQIRAGHEVYLLTLTRGEATKQRKRLGVNKKQMGDIRYEEMRCVEKVLGLSGMTVLNFPDNKLKEMDPYELERSIEAHIETIQPSVIVTYAVHGVSGFHDHLVSHAVVKSVYCKRRREKRAAPERMALFTRMGETDLDGSFRLEASNSDEIDCIVECDKKDMERFHKALDCYETYQDVIEKSGVRNVVDNRVPFEFFQESFNPPLSDIAEGLGHAERSNKTDNR